MGGGESLFSSSAGTLAVVALVLSLLALGGVVIMLARQQRVLGQYQHLMTGTSGGNLEQILNEHIAQVRGTASQVEKLDRLARQMEKTLRHSLQSLGWCASTPFPRWVVTRALLLPWWTAMATAWSSPVCTGVMT